MYRKMCCFYSFNNWLWSLFFKLIIIFNVQFERHSWFCLTFLGKNNKSTKASKLWFFDELNPLFFPTSVLIIKLKFIWFKFASLDQRSMAVDKFWLCFKWSKHFFFSFINRKKREKCLGLSLKRYYFVDEYIKWYNLSQ